MCDGNVIISEQTALNNLPCERRKWVCLSRFSAWRIARKCCWILEALSNSFLRERRENIDRNPANRGQAKGETGDTLSFLGSLLLAALMAAVVDLPLSLSPSIVVVAQSAGGSCWPPTTTVSAGNEFELGLKFPTVLCVDAPANWTGSPLAGPTRPRPRLEVHIEDEPLCWSLPLCCCCCWFHCAAPEVCQSLPIGSSLREKEFGETFGTLATLNKRVREGER